VDLLLGEVELGDAIPIEVEGPQEFHQGQFDMVLDTRGNILEGWEIGRHGAV